MNRTVWLILSYKAGMFMLGRHLGLTCCSRSEATSHFKPFLFNHVNVCVKSLPPGPSRGRAVLVRSMVQIPARKVEVQEEAFCKANHSGQRLDAVLPDLFGSRYSSASGRACHFAAAGTAAAATAAAG